MIDLSSQSNLYFTMLKVEYIGDVVETHTRHLESKELSVNDGPPVMPGSKCWFRREDGDLSEIYYAVYLKFIIRYSTHYVLFSITSGDHNLVTREKWRELIAAIENPKGYYRLLAYENYPLFTSLTAKKSRKVKFTSGGISFLLPKEDCLEAFRKAQEDLDKYPGTGGWHPARYRRSEDERDHFAPGGAKSNETDPPNHDLIDQHHSHLLR